MAESVVFLLRTEAVSEDPFAAVLRAAGYRTFVLGVQEVIWVEPELLRQTLAHPEAYGGLILTSPRSVEAVRRLGESVEAWCRHPVYAVGPRTAEAARALGLRPRGQESGTGISLARFIAMQPRPLHPLLFLCGARRREELPMLLRQHGVPLEERVVYDTRPAALFLPPEAPAPEWVVVFSPSVWESARRLPIDWQRVRVAAIGPTTAQALQQQQVCVDAVAATPTPEGLLQALLIASA
jgi:uroporphyrinogen-III synthase